MATPKEIWSSISRSGLHYLIGFAAILLVQVVPATNGERAARGMEICFAFIGVETVRPLLYRHFSEEVVGKTRFRFVNFFEWVFQKFIDSWHGLLKKIKMLRPDELPRPATAFHLAVSVLVSLLCAPLWAVGPAVAIFVCGDAAAREVGIRLGTYKLPWSLEKTWGGLWAYVTVGIMIGSITILLQEDGFPLYPPGSVSSVPVAIAATAVIGGLVESLLPKGNTLTSRFFDDNAIVPFVSSMTFSVVVSAGMTL